MYVYYNIYYYKNYLKKIIVLAFQRRDCIEEVYTMETLPQTITVSV